MNLKENILYFLENNKGEYISGSDIAKKLNVSRTSIWKAINSLREDGYEIDSITNKGYSLSSNNFILSKHSILKYLNNKNVKIEVFDCIDSTNDYLRNKAECGEEEGYIVISQEQIKGKGRLGKTFYSPPKAGIYMSILLKPNIHAGKALYITTAAAVSVSQAIDSLTGKKSSIKWVNDIFLDNKKVCGILTEGSFDLEGGGMNYAILGIGLNLIIPNYGYPSELKNIAGSIFERDNLPYDYRNRIIGEIINNFFKYYTNLEDKIFLDEYRNKSFIINKDIFVLKGENTEKAIALDIDEEFRLKVKKENGEIVYLSSGDISIRKNY